MDATAMDEMNDSTNNSSSSSTVHSNPEWLKHVILVSQQYGVLLALTIQQSQLLRIDPSQLQPLAAFCFPYASSLITTQFTLEHQSFSFILTDEHRNFTYGYCKQFIHHNVPNTPFALCIIATCDSIEPPESLLHSIYTTTIAQLTSNSVSISPEAFASQYESALVSQWDSILCAHENDTVLRPCLMQSNCRVLSALNSTLKTFGSARFIQLITAILLEKRMIFYSHSLRQLVEGIRGLLSTLDPLMWQGIYIPVVPESLIDVLYAPMPFVTGIHASLKDRVDEMVCRETVMVDVDEGRVEIGKESMFVEMPVKLREKLEFQLGQYETTWMENERCDVDERNEQLSVLLNVFFRLFTSEYLSGYWVEAVDEKMSVVGGVGVKSGDPLARSELSVEEQFWVAFGETQIKEQWTLRASVQHNVNLKKMAYNERKLKKQKEEEEHSDGHVKPNSGGTVPSKSLRAIREHVFKLGGGNSTAESSRKASDDLEHLSSLNNSVSFLMSPQPSASHRSTAASSSSAATHRSLQFKKLFIHPQSK